MSTSGIIHTPGLGKLYQTVGVAAILLLAYALITMVQLPLLGGPPATAEEVFDMFRENRLLGLLRMDLLTTLVMPLYYLLFLSLYMALKKPHDVAVKIAVLLGCAGLTLFLSAPSAFSWLTLSNKFAAAASEAQKSLFLAAGEAIFATDLWHGSSAFVGGLLLQTGMVILSVAMLRSSAFSEWTAWTGIVTHSLDLAHIVFLVLLPPMGVVLLAIGGTLYLAWFPLLARDFTRLAKVEKP